MKKIFTAAALMLLSLAAAGKDVVTVAYAGEAGDAWLGFRQALDEANRQGRFLGVEFRHIRVDADSASSEGMSGASALFTALGEERTVMLARMLPAVPVIHLTSRANAPRRLCQRNLFFASPSEQMLADAMTQWKAAGKDGEGVAVKAWNTTFKRYAAAQVTKRFAEAQGAAMSDEAYAGWAAMRLFAQVVIEQGTSDGAALVEALHGDVQFDGSKGVPMQFRSTGQLNQMLLLVKDDSVVGTAPVRGVHEAHELESLGYTGCKE